ncbi:MAG: hypothetical protein M1835_006994 [Candelina submexicana]|nr:MAG: hypothetical protein M1835_006994 [Candelina submexicana]
MFPTAIRRATAAGAAGAVKNLGKEAKASADQSVLQKGAKRDPELYILLAIMSGAFGMAGWHFGRKPTSASSEQPVSMAQGSMPWQTDSSKGENASEHFKYQYHPGGDPNTKPKDAPSALHSVIVPNVNLPKELHEQFNKWGKE